MKRAISISILLFLLIGVNLAHSGEQFDRHLYVYHTGEQFTVAWDAPTATIIRTEVKVFHYEQNEAVLLPTAIAKIPFGTYQVTFSMPRWGHWILSVRFCYDLDGVETFTTWSDSTDPLVATVNSVGRAWWLYSYAAPVTQN